MSILQESIWFLSLGLLLFFSLLGLICFQSNSTKDARISAEGTSKERQSIHRSKISLWHMMVLGAIIMAIQFGQYTCDRQMKTEKERIVLSP